MLRNINNFFNILKKGRVKKTLIDGDMIPVGTRDTINKSKYYDTAITFKDLKDQVATAGAQGPPGVAGPAGATGPEGPAGPVGATGLQFVGTFDPDRPDQGDGNRYTVGDVVFYNGSSYVLNTDITTATPTPLDDPEGTPPAGNPLWDFLALQGLQGPAGPGGFSVSDASRITSVPTGGAQFAFRQLLIPANSFAVGDVFNVIAAFIAVSGAGTFTYETYINTVPGLGGATPLFDIKMAASREYMNTIQTFYIDGVGPTTGPTGNLNTITNGFSQYDNAASNLSIDWTVDQYFIIAGRNASSRDVINVGAKIF